MNTDFQCTVDSDLLARFKTALALSKMTAEEALELMMKEFIATAATRCFR